MNALAPAIMNLNAMGNNNGENLVKGFMGDAEFAQRLYDLGHKDDSILVDPSVETILKALSRDSKIEDSSTQGYLKSSDWKNREGDENWVLEESFLNRANLVKAFLDRVIKPFMQKIRDINDYVQSNDREAINDIAQTKFNQIKKMLEPYLGEPQTY